MNKAKFISFASVISEMKQSDMFMSVKMRILETPKANLNGVRVTEAFIDEIIADVDRYVGLPLYADVKSLLSGKYGNLGHMYNAKTGEFYSTQIGSFYQFEKEEFKGGAYLVGYARIPKRNMKLSKAIAELFAEGSLKFSFEIACADYTEDEEGIFIIDASENNYLEGTAIVTFPACEDAIALEFVAQREAGNAERGEMEMAEVKKLETQEVAAEEQTEATTVEQTETQPEVNTAEEKVEEAQAETTEPETEEASCKEEEKKNAAVYVDTTTTVTETTHAYDTDTGKSAYTKVEITEGVSDTIEGNLVETEEGLRVAEEDKSEETTQTAEDSDGAGELGNNTEETEESDPDTAAEDIGNSVSQTEEKKKTAEEMIAELSETIRSLAEEVKSLKEQQAAALENAVKHVEAEAINPFVGSAMNQNSYYDLLQPAEKQTGYDLLTK